MLDELENDFTFAIGLQDVAPATIEIKTCFTLSLLNSDIWNLECQRPAQWTPGRGKRCCHTWQRHIRTCPWHPLAMWWKAFIDNSFKNDLILILVTLCQAHQFVYVQTFDKLLHLYALHFILLGLVCRAQTAGRCLRRQLPQSQCSPKALMPESTSPCPVPRPCPKSVATWCIDQTTTFFLAAK